VSSAVAVVLLLGGAFLFSFGMTLAVNADSDGVTTLTTMVFTFFGGFAIGAGGWTLWRRGWLK